MLVLDRPDKIFAAYRKVAAQVIPMKNRQFGMNWSTENNPGRLKGLLVSQMNKQHELKGTVPWFMFLMRTLN